MVNLKLTLGFSSKLSAPNSVSGHPQHYIAGQVSVPFDRSLAQFSAISSNIPCKLLHRFKSQCCLDLR